MQQVLVTGGAGYIGSHTCVALIEAGFQPVVVDNLSNASPEAIRRVEEITGHSIPFYEVDVRDQAALAAVLADHDVVATIHFAGLKAVGESVAQPLRYYDNNVGGSVRLLEVLQRHGVRTFVFSSSATVYGDPERVPIRETDPAGRTTNPYGRSKWMVEEILRDLHVAEPDWRLGILRYFNPVGAHPSGRIGEDPAGIPNNLMPFIAQVAVGRRDHLNIFGNDYDTPDGTGVRDYIHVMDLAEGHIAALRYLLTRDAGEVLTVNLGTGRGISVLEMVKAFERVNGVPVPYRFAPCRPGDVAQCYADPSLAQERLGWRATRTLEDMVRDTWRWQSQNPQGYGEKA